MKDHSNKPNKKTITSVEFGSDFGDINSPKIVDTILMNKEKKKDKHKETRDKDKS